MAENAFKADWPSFALGFNTGKSKGGGGAELNIAYGDTAPEDTSKIWVKSQKPEKVRVEPLAFSEVIDYPLTEAYKRPINCVAYGDKIYMFGGRTASATAYGYLTVYDTVTGETELNKTISTASSTSCCLGDDCIYVVSGSKIYRFIPEPGSFVLLTSNVPSDVQGVNCFYVEGVIYLFNFYKKLVYKYRIDTNDFAEVEGVITTQRSAPRFAQVGTTIYIFGGDGTGNTSQSTAWKFDTTNDTLSQIKSMPKAMSQFGCVEYGGNILIIGGATKKSSGHTYHNTVYQYSPSSDDYRTLDGTLISTRYEFVCAPVNGKVYIFPSTLVANDTIEKYSPYPNIESKTLGMNYRTDGTKIPIINGETVHVDTNIGGTYMGDENGVGQPVEALMFKDGEWTNI